VAFVVQSQKLLLTMKHLFLFRALANPAGLRVQLAYIMSQPLKEIALLHKL
jgi:hypothetical protein